MSFRRFPGWSPLPRLEALVLTLAAAKAPSAAASVTGAASVTLLDKLGPMVADLKTEKVTIFEEGQPRLAGL